MHVQETPNIVFKFRRPSGTPSCKPSEAMTQALHQFARSDEMQAFVSNEVLRDWKDRSQYNAPDDWVFASPRMHGKQPLWPDTLLKDHIRPAAIRAGIQKQVGFHTFRHSLATLLKANGEDIKTVQELLRHANSRITLDIYAQGTTKAKRAAQEKVLQSFLPARAEAIAEGNGVTVTFVTAS